MSRQKQNPITFGALKDVIATYSLNLSATMPKPADPPQVTPGPIAPAELDQDAGGGYNTDHTFPQT
ncbi:MAG TPA: hypothetical protein VF023_12235 [Bryobacteraceae bacterium]|jgi:hypothetical protein